MLVGESLARLVRLVVVPRQMVHSRLRTVPGYGVYYTAFYP